MGAAPVSLDQGPPLPPNLQPPPQPTVQGLAGTQGGGQPGGGSASLQAAVIDKLMFIESSLNQIGLMMPAAAPVVQGFIDQMRKQMGTLLAQGATPPPAQGAGGSAGGGPGAGLMQAPTS